MGPERALTDDACREQNLDAEAPAKADRRRGLLDAACVTIARRGLRGLRVEEVAAEAGVSTALIYYHFHDRGGLLAAAFDHVDRVIAGYTDAGTDALPPLRRLVAQAVNEFPDDPRAREMTVAWSEMWAGARFEPSLLERVTAPMAKWVAAFARAIREAQAAAEVDASVDATDSAIRIVALVEGLRLRWLQGELSTAEVRRLVTEGIRRELLQPPTLDCEAGGIDEKAAGEIGQNGDVLTRGSGQRSIDVD